jgi:ribosomal subunit interface protein
MLIAYVKGRGFKVSTDLKKSIEGKLERQLRKVIDRIVEVHACLSEDMKAKSKDKRHKVSIRVMVKGAKDIVVSRFHQEIDGAFNVAMDVLKVTVDTVKAKTQKPQHRDGHWQADYSGKSETKSSIRKKSVAVKKKASKTGRPKLKAKFSPVGKTAANDSRTRIAA